MKTTLVLFILALLLFAHHNAPSQSYPFYRTYTTNDFKGGGATNRWYPSYPPNVGYASATNLFYSSYVTNVYPSVSPSAGPPPSENAPPPVPQARILSAAPVWKGTLLFEIGVAGTPGVRYALESSTNLLAWTVEKEVFITRAGTGVVSVPFSPEGYKFFRVRGGG